MPLIPTLRRCAAILLLLLALPAARAEPLPVVATFSILGDLVARVGGDDVRVTTLVGADADTHNFQPRPSDARLVGGARLVVANGLGFDTWIERLARSAGVADRLLVASRGITPLTAADTGGHRHGHKHGHGHGEADPHLWQDVTQVRRYVRNIADALAAADPARADAYRERAARFDDALRALDEEIRRTLDTLPPAARRVVTTHESFAYFGKAYGVRFLAAKGISNQSEPSAADIARLIRQLRQEKVPAVFIENISDPRLGEMIRGESGARLGGTLYSDALSAPDGPAPDYLAMMRHNLATLMDGLGR